MAESQIAHRHRLELEAMRANIAGERRGTWFGGLATILTVVGSFYLIAIGKSLEGLGTILLALAKIRILAWNQVLIITLSILFRYLYVLS